MLVLRGLARTPLLGSKGSAALLRVPAVLVSSVLVTAVLVATSMLVTAVFLGCGDDSPTRTPDPEAGDPGWTEVVFPSSIDRGLLYGVKSRGGRSLALYQTEDRESFVLEEEDGGWISKRLERYVQLIDLEINSKGRAVLVGLVAETAGVRPVIIVDDGDWNRIPLEGIWGGLQSVAVDDTDRFLAAGLGLGSILAYEGEVGSRWSRSEIPVDTGRGNQKKSIVDHHFHDGGWLACGFNEDWRNSPGSPFQFLVRERAGTWELIDTPCEGCLGYDFRALAVDAAGRILLAGRRVSEPESGPERSEAFLWRFDPGLEQWEELELPQPMTLSRVNDLLISSDGVIYLACGIDEPSLEIDGAYLVRMDGSGTTEIEWAERGSFLRQLAESPRGILAAGQRGRDNSSTPLMLLRGPSILN